MRFLKTFALVILLPLAIWFVIAINKDPLEAFGEPSSEFSVATNDSYPVGNRKYSDLQLIGKIGDTVRITISLPPGHGKENKRWPIVFIIGGLEIGRKSLSYVKDHGDNILISYEYPYSPDYWYEGAGLNEVLRIRKSIYSVPGQLASVIHWARQQIWADTSRTSLLGYSFGAIALPAVQHLAQTYQIPIHATIMGYGGTDIQKMLLHNFKGRSRWVNSFSTNFAAFAIRAMEPELHLPHLKGNFLLINGKHDEQIPEKSYLEFQKLAPEPKKIVNLNAGHLHPRKPELTSQLIEISSQWLYRQEVINL